MIQSRTISHWMLQTERRVRRAASIAASVWVGSPWHDSIGALAGILVAVVLTPATPQAFHDPEPDEVGGGP